MVGSPPCKMLSLVSPRWRKVWRDAWMYRARSLMVVLAIAAGVSGSGIVLVAWGLVRRATKEGFLASDPAAATLYTQRVDGELLRLASEVPGVRDAQARRTTALSARVLGANRTALVFTYPDFADVRIGKVRSENGHWPPATGEIVLETSSVAFSASGVGDSLFLLADGSAGRSLPITGIARDVSLAPGWMEQVIYAFASQSTLTMLGLDSSLNEIRIVVDDSIAAQGDVRRVANRLRALIEAGGRAVTDIDVPVPGEHVHAAQMESLTFTQGAFGLLALVVTAFLVVNLISALLAGQIREIGVMKTLGAESPALTRMYLAYAAGLGAVGLTVGAPIALVVGRRYGAFKGELLNFDIAQYAVPWWTVVVLVGTGVGVPLLASALPVWRATRASIASALRDVGLDRDGRTDRPLGVLAFFSRPTALAVANAFRKRQRLVLTLLAIAAGGSVYLGARNLRRAVIDSLDVAFGSSRFDYSVRVAAGQPAAALERLVQEVPGTAVVEGWPAARAALTDASADGHPFALLAPPLNTRLFEPNVAEGRWLVATDSNALVINRSLLRREPSLGVGTTVEFPLAGRRTRWQVVGIIDTDLPPTAYTSRSVFARQTGDSLIRSLFVSTTARGVVGQVEHIQAVRRTLDERGWRTTGSQRVAEARRVTENHLVMIVDFLGVMSWVIIAVGGLGLASTMGLSVLERTRELGVLRSLGATPRALLRMVQAEGLVIALLGGLAAIPLSMPISAVLASSFGRIMMRVPVVWIAGLSDIGRWLALVLIIAIAASALPAMRATRISIARALAYE